MPDRMEELTPVDKNDEYWDLGVGKRSTRFVQLTDHIDNGKHDCIYFDGANLRPSLGEKRSRARRG